MLEIEPYVCLYALDFSKAFDTVKHSALLQTISQFGLPDEIFNWLNSFLQDRVHSTKWAEIISSNVSFNAGVVQGSAVGPAAYVLCASALQPIHAANKLFKYADDSYLLVPASNCHTTTEEFENITHWSDYYNIKLNPNKCKEMIIFSKNRSQRHLLPQPCSAIHGITRVKSLTILGITISDCMTLDEHIADLSATANQTLFALRTLKRSGLSDDAIWSVCRATLIAKIMYGSPAWCGFANKSHIDFLESIIRRAVRWNLYPANGPSVTSMMQEADKKLFRTILCNKSHVMHSLLPPIKSTPYNLRSRAHDRTLPLKTFTLSKNFIYRVLYSDLH